MGSAEYKRSLIRVRETSGQDVPYYRRDVHDWGRANIHFLELLCERGMGFLHTREILLDTLKVKFLAIFHEIELSELFCLRAASVLLVSATIQTS